VQPNSCQIGSLGIFTRKSSYVMSRRSLKDAEQIIEIFLPVNNSLIDYPVKRYNRAFELASDVINENFTARVIC
jgi:adenosine deaminase